MATRVLTTEKRNDRRQCESLKQNETQIHLFVPFGFFEPCGQWYLSVTDLSAPNIALPAEDVVL